MIQLTCESCGRTIVAAGDRPAFARCRTPGVEWCQFGADRPEVGVFEKLANFAKATARWVAAGRPTRSAAEIESIEAICRACPLFSEEGGPHCTLCGCTINASPHGLENKLAMATESCPADPPLWTAAY